jgi:hypothetical protein
VRPHLRPGLQVLRRDVRTLQLGLDWPGVAVFPDSPAVQAVLAAIDGIRDTTAVVLTAALESGADEQDCSAALDALIDCGAVIDSAHHLRGSMSEAAWASTWLLAGPTGCASDLAAGRGSRIAEVWGTGQVADDLRRLLPEWGLTLDPTAADLVILASDHEPSRRMSDEVMADGRPHLWVVVRELVGVLGPFVSPGVTACLRCLDQVRAEIDPAWPTLVEAVSARRGHVHACDPLLARLVATWAVQEVSVWASGLQPQTWGRTIEIPLGIGVVSVQPSHAHPACGCGWPIWQDTMGA